MWSLRIFHVSASWTGIQVHQHPGEPAFHSRHRHSHPGGLPAVLCPAFLIPSLSLKNCHSCGCGGTSCSACRTWTHFVWTRLRKRLVLEQKRLWLEVWWLFSSLSSPHLFGWKAAWIMSDPFTTEWTCIVYLHRIFSNLAFASPWPN